MSVFLTRMGPERVSRVTLTNEELKTLADYNQGKYVVLVPKQGKGTIIFPTYLCVELHAGSSVLTGAVNDLYCQHMEDDGEVQANSAVNYLNMTNFIDQATDQVTFGVPHFNVLDWAPYRDNKNFGITSFSNNFGGNAENDARLSVEITYRVQRRVAAVI